MTSSRLSSTAILIFSSLLILMLAAACSKNKKVRGKDLIPRDTLVEMMVEMHLIDGLTNDVAYYRKYNPNDTIDLYGSVYEKYDVTREEFDASLLEYASIPRQLDALYGDILTELNLMQEELDRQKQEELDRLKNKDQSKQLPPEVENKSKNQSPRKPGKESLELR